jgi:hypothetical protein
MPKKRTVLKLAFDPGASLSKAIGSCGEQFLPLVMPPDVIERRSENLDCHRCQTGIDLLDRSFVGVENNYYAIGSLAQALGSFQALKPLKSTTIVYKILAMVSIMAQRLDLGTDFDLELGCLLPPGEFPDREDIERSLTLALADFDTPIGAMSIKLLRCDFHLEGLGIITLQNANGRQTHGTGITLMAGHRNLTFYVTRANGVIGIETCTLGFHHWAKAVRSMTYDYDLADLSTAIASYWGKKDEKGEKDEAALLPLLKHQKPELSQPELKRLTDAIEQSCPEYCDSIFRWLDENLPDRIDELMLAGGVGDVLQSELVKYFRGRMSAHPKYPAGKGAIFNSSLFNLPKLELAEGYQSRMADVYCVWKYLMPDAAPKARARAKS